MIKTLHVHDNNSYSKIIPHPQQEKTRTFLHLAPRENKNNSSFHKKRKQKQFPFTTTTDNKNPHLNKNPVLELGGAREVDVLGEIGFEQELGDQLLAKDLHEDLRHPCLLLNRTVVFDGEDDGVRRSDKGTAIYCFHDVSVWKACSC